MTHHTTNFALSRLQQQRQEPAKRSNKASGGAKSWIGDFEIPGGYVVRQGHAVAAKPIRNIGPRDSEIVQLAIKSFGYLLPLRAVETLAGFASRIELACRDAKARAIADTLHRLSA